MAYGHRYMPPTKGTGCPAGNSGWRYAQQFDNPELPELKSPVLSDSGIVAVCRVEWL